MAAKYAQVARSTPEEEDGTCATIGRELSSGRVGSGSCSRLMLLVVALYTTVCVFIRLLAMVGVEPITYEY
jgi:hypothetical protein